MTASCPKPMLPVGGRPVIDRVLARDAQSGVREVFMNLHYRADQLTDFCGDGRRWGLHITYVFEAELLGTAGAVKNFGPRLGEDSPFFVVYGDNFLECDLAGLWKFHVAHGGLGTVALFEKDDVTGSGIVEI